MNFFDLHKKEKYIFLGNVWDTLSAIIMQNSGFQALGTTSWGMANTLGYNDGERISFADYYNIIKKIKAVIDIPLSVDIESGFANKEKEIITNILSLAEIGCSGINIEDAAAGKLKDSIEHAKLLKNIRLDLDKNGFANFFINARTDTYLKLSNPLEETIKRISVYEQSGANGVFVPGIENMSEIREIIDYISIPLNVMSTPNCTSLKEMKEIGVKRFSFGNAMSDAVISYVENLSRQIQAEQSTKILYNHPSINTIFKD